MWILLMLALTGLPREVRVQTLDGACVTGQLRELKGQRLVIQSGDEQHDYSTHDVLQLDVAPKDPAAASLFTVELSDGSRVRAASFETHGEEASITLGAERSLKLPISSVSRVRRADATDAEMQQWRQITDAEAASDVIVIRKKESLDYLDGVTHDVSRDQVHFELDGEVVPVRLEKLFGLIYYRRRNPDPKQAQCDVYDRQGSQFAASEITLEENELDIHLVGGGALKLPWADLARLDFSRGKVLYLSDLDWDGRESQRTSLFGPARPIDPHLDLFAPQRDRAMDGGELLVGQKSYAKGLALHSRTRLMYRLPAGFRRFAATAGIDDRMDRRGNVQLTIEADGNQLFDKSITGADQPLPIDLNIEGAKRLTVLVDFGADQDVSDHLDLCDAKLIK